MPMYEYVCPECSGRWTLLRRIADRDIKPICVSCSNEMNRMISMPTMHVWDQGRSFPHMRAEGDGEMTFPDRNTYESHLKSRGIAETSTSAPIKRPHGNKVVMEEKI